MTNEIEKVAKEAAARIASEWQMGGLADGVYGELAVEVAQSVADWVARECARICKETGAYRDDDDLVSECVAAIRDRFGIKE